MKLQRYKLVGCDKVADRCRAYMLGSGEGKYVDHSEALDWFESLLTPKTPCQCGCTECEGYDNGYNDAITDMRALIAAERGKV